MRDNQKVASEHHAPMTLLHQFFDDTAGRVPSHVALRYRDLRLTYAELRERSVRLSRGLAGRGIGRGDRVLIYLQNRPEVIECALACSRLGAMFVPVSPMLRQRQLAYVLRDSGARIAIASGSAVVAPVELLKASPEIDVVAVCDPVAGAPDASGRVVAYEDLIAGSATTEVWSGAIDKDPAAILYTSGSTGPPKGVVVSHKNLVSGAQCVARYLQAQPDDCVLAALPLSFDYGFSQVSVSFAVGACAVLTNYSTPVALMKELAAHRVTALAGVPTMWAQLAAADWPATVTEHLRYITNSGGALLISTIDTLRRKLTSTQIYCMYGLTEAFRSTYLDPGQLSRRPGSIGKAIPNQEILVLRPDGSHCAPGEIGELVHRGSLVTLGYWNNPEATQKRFRPVPPRLSQLPCEEMAVWSGDHVRYDKDGFLYFVGRADQLIKTSGYRVSPTEVEEVVAEVAGVVEVVAVGVRDEVLGQRICVAVTSASNDPELGERARQYCRVHLPPYMAPSEIRLVEAIPKNVNGKPDRSLVARSVFSDSSQIPDSRE
jgi:acyl-CoA ligase (AMP-forming) (exosortase A-associated)